MCFQSEDETEYWRLKALCYEKDIGSAGDVTINKRGRCSPSINGEGERENIHALP